MLLYIGTSVDAALYWHIGRGCFILAHRSMLLYIGTSVDAALY
jgi:hypothetical protein